MNEKPKSKIGWRILRRVLIALAVFATLVAVFYTEENWRGKRAWENYRHKWEAKGENFDWQALVPKTVPDDQNFFTSSIIKSNVVMSPWRSDGSEPDYNSGSGGTGYLAGVKIKITDLAAWQTYYRNPTNPSLTKEFPIAPQPQTPAADVLLALSKYDSSIEELRQASQRPYALAPLDYKNGFDAVAPLIPILAELKRFTQGLQLRAIAELADGQNAKALADVKLLLYLNESLRNSPYLISHLVRIAIVSIGLQPVWEGLAEHKWSDEQLVALDDELAKLNFLADYQFTMRGELAASILKIDGLRQDRREVAQISFNSDIENDNDKDIWKKIRNIAKAGGLYLMPGGWFYRNEMAIAQMHQDWNAKMVDAERAIVSPEAIQRANLSAGGKHALPWNIYARQMLPAFGAFARKIAQIQVQVDLARVACALERYRLAHGEYPETLNAIAPQFIAQVPHDIINGQQLHYRREANGQFVLYSVGWNETDDGGQVAFRKGGSVDRFAGDWVWQYTAK